MNLQLCWIQGRVNLTKRWNCYNTNFTQWRNHLAEFWPFKAPYQTKLFSTIKFDVCLSWISKCMNNVACEQAHLFGYREPVKRGKVSLHASYWFLNSAPREVSSRRFTCVGQFDNTKANNLFTARNICKSKSQQKQANYFEINRISTVLN